ncbi:DNA polymerase delta small subunit [Trichomonascus vanleenenianus]|uniref:DNA-directed DNA polymerase delta subunit POL31 n=1 Tax=Trichomonascus vanleenenianus TaxID=2268995 RepID=UPI003ECBAC81
MSASDGSSNGLLREPTGEYRTLSRDPSVSSGFNDKFIIPFSKRNYNQQYCNIYFARLRQLRSIVAEQASRAWDGMKVGKDLTVERVDKVLDVRQGKLVWILGTVYKEMQFKPDILKEVTRSQYGAPEPQPEKYFNMDTDQVLLEDESGRIELTGDFVRSQQTLVTGCVVAVLGTENLSSKFEVVDIKFPEYAPQAPLQPQLEPAQRRRYLAFVSGIMAGDKSEDPRRLEMLSEFLCGELGGEEDQASIESEIVSVVIAGDSINQRKDLFLSEGVMKAIDNSSSEQRKFGKKKDTYNPDATRAFDDFLSEVLGSVPVTILPGKNDPSSVSMPEQPLHAALLMKSAKQAVGSNVLSRLTNPAWFEVNGVHVFGTSGQVIDDMYKYGDYNDRLKLMDLTMRWRHSAPTCPDTLSSYPYNEDIDPYIMEKTPHIYFAGNQPSFCTRLVQSKDSNGKDVVIRYVSIPRFVTTGEVVLVDMDTLEVKNVSIGAI